MLYQMKSLNLGKIRKEFIMLTIFHAEQFNLRIQKLEVSDEIKQGFYKLVNEFLKDLLEIAEIDINELEKTENFKSMMEKAKSINQQDLNPSVI